MLKSIIRKALATAGYAVFRTRDRYIEDGLFTINNHHFRRDRAFQDAYIRGLKASSGVDPAFEWRVHVALWAPLTIALVLGLLQPVKGAIVGWQWANRMHGFNPDVPDDGMIPDRREDSDP